MKNERTRRASFPLFALLLVAFAGALATPAEAQTAKLGKKYYEDRFNGFRFKYPDGWMPVPVQETMAPLGMLAKMEGFSLSTKIEALSAVYDTTPSLQVIELRDRLVDAVSGEDSGGLKGRVTTEKGRQDLGGLLKLLYGHFRDFDISEPEADEETKIKKLDVHHRTWTAFTGDYDITLDTYTFRLPDRDIALVFDVATQHEKKWTKVFSKVAKTFELMEREQAMSLGKKATYEEVLAYHEQEASRTPGWRVVRTPSERFVIKTSSDNDRFIDNVIDRLEASRDLFEKEFPPDKPIDHVSVVRVCADEEEFHSYGGTGGGTAGWFNPSTTELVLFDFVEYNRNFTYAVMTHEAFHQYCHFLFAQSEAHRWFDEGHGDYYGGVKFTGRRAEVTPKMPAGLERLTGAKELVKTGQYKPLAEHLNYSHSQWQNQGPSNVSCYEQSWSIIYMLRQGMEGKVPSKIWKDEYAHIIPDYIAALKNGFLEAYDELRKEREEDAKKAGHELTPEELAINRFDLSLTRKKKIWKDAMAASWGQIDLDEFEENWLTYVDKYL